MSEAGVNKSVPAIRFKGFDEDWVHKHLGCFGSVAMNKRIFKEQTFDKGDIPFFKIGTFGDSPDAFISKELFDEYKLKYSFPEKGDLLISASGSIGRIVEYSGADEYFQDSNIVWLKHEGRIKNSFLKVFYSRVRWSGLEGSTIKRLYNKNILETSISIPTPEEQTKIGEYFQELDTLIAGHRGKREKLLQLKKSLLEKMFPKQGQDKPEIRFTGFDEDWNYIEFEKIVSRVTNACNDSALPRVEYEDIIPGRGQLNKEIGKKKSTKVGIEFQIGDVLYGKLRPYLKNWLLPDFKGVAVGDFWVLRSNEFNRELIFYIVQTDSFDKVANQSAGSKMPRADWRLVSKSRFSVPKNSQEQTRIGQLFKHTDTLITQHQSQIDKLNNIKQACLAQMFV